MKDVRFHHVSPPFWMSQLQAGLLLSSSLQPPPQLSAAPQPSFFASPHALWPWWWTHQQRHRLQSKVVRTCPKRLEAERYLKKVQNQWSIVMGMQCTVSFIDASGPVRQLFGQGNNEKWPHFNRNFIGLEVSWRSLLYSSLNKPIDCISLFLSWLGSFFGNWFFPIEMWFAHQNFCQGTTHDHPTWTFSWGFGKQLGWI